MRYRRNLPQVQGDLFLCDAGMETDIIFNRSHEIREFAAHTLLADEAGRAVMADYMTGFIQLAQGMDCGLILDAPTWRAQTHWSQALGEDADFLKKANKDAAAFVARLRAAANNEKPIVINAAIGPRGDAYRPETLISVEEAEDYFAEQIEWLVDSEADMVTALTFTQGPEATGFCRAAAAHGMPSVVSFTVETDGRLPSGEALADAIAMVDELGDARPAYFMVNCAHPDHFRDVLTAGEWRRRIRGIRANASRMSHAELDEALELDDGDPDELAGDYAALREAMPWLNIFGGCCGSDIRHVAAIAHRVAA